jgi:hypothetical protein
MSADPGERIKWEAHNQYPENTCECRCGAIFRSHSRYSSTRGLISRKPCPACGKDDGLRAARSDPEEMTITKKDIR